MNPGQFARFLAHGNPIAIQKGGTVGSIEASSGRGNQRELFTQLRLICVDARKRNLQEILGDQFPLGHYGVQLDDSKMTVSVAIDFRGEGAACAVNRIAKPRCGNSLRSSRVSLCR